MNAPGVRAQQLPPISASMAEPATVGHSVMVCSVMGHTVWGGECPRGTSPTASPNQCKHGRTRHRGADTLVCPTMGRPVWGGECPTGANPPVRTSGRIFTDSSHPSKPSRFRPTVARTSGRKLGPSGTSHSDFPHASSPHATNLRRRLRCWCMVTRGMRCLCMAVVTADGLSPVDSDDDTGVSWFVLTWLGYMSV